MDTGRFDALTRALVDPTSRRATLGAALGGLLIALGVVDADARKKTKKKRKRKKKKQEEALSTDSACPPGEVSCQGTEPIRCCPEFRPVCGPEISDGTYNCCPPNTKVCPPGGAFPVGACCPAEHQCCPPSFNGTSHCCPPQSFCTRGRQGGDERGGCCLLGDCQADGDCPIGQHCGREGCCAPDCNVICRGLTGAAECCETCTPACGSDATCCHQTSDGHTNECLETGQVHCRHENGAIIECPGNTIACCQDEETGGIHCWGGPEPCPHWRSAARSDLRELTHGDVGR